MEENNQKIIELVNLDIDSIQANIKQLSSSLKKAKLELSNKIKIRSLASGEKAIKKKYPKKTVQ